MMIIIEAPAKVKSMRVSLDDLGIQANVIATCGHIKKFPDSLWPAGINNNMEPTNLSLKSMRTVERIQESAKKSKCLIIATDPDSEGHLIANDVFDLAVEVNPGIVVYRASVYGMDTQHVKVAMETLKSFDPTLAFEATRRRSIDRLISSAISDKEKGIYAGRVMTTTLAYLNRVKDTAMSVPRRPLTGAECMYHGSMAIGVTPREGAEIMQSLYEDGEMSYPRSDSARVTSRTAELLKKYYKTNVRVDNQADSGAHPAPYPMKKVDVATPLEYMDKREGMLSFIARPFCSVGQSNEFILKEDPGKETVEHKVMKTMMLIGVGRPGTMPAISDKLVNYHKAVNPDGSISEKGIRIVNHGRIITEPETVMLTREWIGRGGQIADVLRTTGLWGTIGAHLNNEKGSDAVNRHHMLNEINVNEGDRIMA